MKQHKIKILSAAIVLALLLFSLWYGGAAPGLRGFQPESTPTETVTASPEPADAVEMLTEPEKTDASVASAEPKAAAPKKETLEKETAAAPGSSNMQPETAASAAGQTENSKTNKTNAETTCTLSVRCDTILLNMKWLSDGKAELVPADGVIFPEKTVVFYEGESVFDVLIREMRQNKIHLEFTDTPVYNSAYIEGIANLYEFDCGERSGWMYKVNGRFPDYGCSRYTVSPGDKIEWVYTCDLGADVGKSSFPGSSGG